MKKTIYFLLTLILSQTTAVLAQSKNITLEEAIFTALQNNRDIKIAMMEVNKADAAVSEAFGYALPSVDITANFAHFVEKPKTPFPNFEAMLGNATYDILFDENVLPYDESKFKPMDFSLMSLAQANSFEAKAQVTQILFNSAVFRGIGASQIYLNLSKEQLSGTISKTALDIKKAFYGVLLTQKMLNIFEASLINAEENLRNVKSMYKQGLVSEFDAMQVEVQVENLRPQIMDLSNKLQGAKDGLKMLMGIDQSEEISLIGEIVYSPELLPDETETIENALTNNFDIKTLNIKQQVDEEFIALDQSENWPTIAAFGSFNYAGSSEDLNFLTYNSTIVGLTFSMNVFKGRQTANRVEQSTIVALQTKEQLSLLKDYIATQVKGKVLQVQKVEMQINSVTKNVDLAQKAYDISVTRYKEGTGTQLEIKNADIELRTAKINRLQSVYEYIVAQAELDQLLGKLESKYYNYVQSNLEN